MALSDVLLLAQSLKTGVIIAAYNSGAPGSPEYAAAITWGISQLQTQQANLQQLMVQNGGKLVTQVQAGESVTFSAPMSLQEQLAAYSKAIMELMGLTWIQRRTTARYLY